MKTRSETFKANNGALVEVGTVTHEGRDFAALGSVIDHDHGVIVGYPKGNKLATWNGIEIDGLTLRITSSWPAVFFGHRSWIGSSMYAYRATYKGQNYHGRGFGEGTVLKLRASRKREDSAEPTRDSE
jgi:hypothetical protein